MDNYSYIVRPVRGCWLIARLFFCIFFVGVFYFAAAAQDRIFDQPHAELPKIAGAQDVNGNSRLQIDFLSNDELDPKADSIIARAIQRLGGDRYLHIKTQVSKGKFTVMKAGTVISFQTFLDVVVFPDRQRTEFKSGGTKHIQVNTGETGWVYDGDQELVKIQTPGQVANFKRGIRTSLDNVLRSYWKGDAELTYVGKRAATLGKRNDVVKLTYKDGFIVEFEFAADDGLPQKAIFKRTDVSGEEIAEEDRYAQFIELKGIQYPFVVDRFTNGIHLSRINYDSVEVNQPIPETVFDKPATPKDARKDIKISGK